MDTSVTVNVAQSSPVASTVFLNPVNITYGTALANGQISGTATYPIGGTPTAIPGTFAYTTAAGLVLQAGTGQSEGVTFTPDDAANYAPVSLTVTVNVAQATPTVTSVNAVNIPYGTALANIQLGGSASYVVNGSTVSVPGTFSYTSASGSVPGAGSGQSEAVTFTPDRCDRLYHGVLDRIRQRLAGNADSHQLQRGEYHLRHGPGEHSAQRHRLVQL